MRYWQDGDLCLDVEIFFLFNFLVMEKFQVRIMYRVRFENKNFRIRKLIKCEVRFFNVLFEQLFKIL